MKSSPDYASDNDERLIRRIAELQGEALAQLYERYKRMIFSLALAIVNDRATAEEITMDVFMRVWQKADSYRAEQAKVSTWLIHIARHHAIDVLRRRSVRPDHSAVPWKEDDLQADFPEHDLQESVEISLQRERVHAALAQLPPEQHQVLALAYFGGYTQRQIAEVLKQPLGTIKTRLRLALQKLHHSLYKEQVWQEKSAETPSAYNITKEE